MMDCTNYLIVMDFISRQFSVLSSATENRALSYSQSLQITLRPVNQSGHRTGSCGQEEANQRPGEFKFCSMERLWFFVMISFTVSQ